MQSIFRQNNVGSVFVAILVIIYSITFAPYIFTGYLDQQSILIRLSVEAGAIFILALFALKCSHRWTTIMLGILTIWLGIELIAFMSTEREIRNLISSSAKLGFVIFLINAMLARPQFRKIMSQLVVSSSNFAAICTIVAYLSFITFPPTAHNTWNNDNTNWIGTYEYYNYGIFGNVILKRFASSGSFVPRVTFWIAEPGLLSYVFATNIANLYLSKLSSNRKIWIVVNTLSGLLTGSASFFIFATSCAGWLFFRESRKISASTLRISGAFLIIVGTVFCTIKMQTLTERVLADTSIVDRLNRFFSAIKLLNYHSIFDVLIGIGSGAISKYIGVASSIGFANLAIERGLLTSLIVIGLLWKLGHRNPLMLLTVTIYNLTFDMFWWPYFWLPLIAGYFCSDACPD